LFEGPKAGRRAVGGDHLTCASTQVRWFLEFGTYHEQSDIYTPFFVGFVEIFRFHDAASGQQVFLRRFNFWGVVSGRKPTICQTGTRQNGWMTTNSAHPDGLQGPEDLQSSHRYRQQFSRPMAKHNKNAGSRGFDRM